MRIIKFAWVCRNIHFNEIERVELTDKMLIDRSYPSWIMTDNCEILAKILPTGLKDKNGIELWEGDIVSGEWCTGFTGKSRRFKKFNQPVLWSVDRWCLKFHENYNYRFFPHWDEVEVIGNIYENPELIEPCLK